MHDATKEKIEVNIFEDRKSMGESASHAVAKGINKLMENQQFVNMVFAAAPSQKEFLLFLSQEKGVDWTRVNAFHMDEYIGLEKNSPQLFGNFLKSNLFEKVPFHQIHYINGEEKDKECQRYAELLGNNPPDIVCMGIGENAHIAFNDPHVANFNDPQSVKIVELDLDCRQQQVNDGCFEEIGQVPKFAITLTFPTLMQAKYIYCIAPGKNKADAVYHTLKSEINEIYPSTILRRHNQVVMYMDQSSSSNI